MPEVLHPEETVTTILFVRHGQTEQTEQGKLYCDPAAVLTERGKKQAEAIARWIHREEPGGLIASTAKRVTGTAQVLSAALCLPVQLAEQLNEQDVGEWEGKSYLELKKNQPDEYNRWLQDPIRSSPPGGESIEDVYRRAGVVLKGLIAEKFGRKIALVTHAGIIRSAIIEALGMPVDNFWRISVPTGSVSRIDYTSNYATLQYMAICPELIYS